MSPARRCCSIAPRIAVVDQPVVAGIERPHAADEARVVEERDGERERDEGERQQQCGAAASAPAAAAPRRRRAAAAPARRSARPAPRRSARAAWRAADRCGSPRRRCAGRRPRRVERAARHRGVADRRRTAPSAPSHSTSPRQHSALPTKSAGKRYITNHGISQPPVMQERRERRSRVARSTSLTARVPVVADLVDEPEAQPDRIGEIDARSRAAKRPARPKMPSAENAKARSGKPWPRQQPIGARDRSGAPADSARRTRAAMKRKTARRQPGFERAARRRSTRKTLWPSSMRGAGSDRPARAGNAGHRQRAEPPRAARATPCRCTISTAATTSSAKRGRSLSGSPSAASTSDERRELHPGLRRGARSRARSINGWMRRISGRTVSPRRGVVEPAISTILGAPSSEEALHATRAFALRRHPAERRRRWRCRRTPRMIFVVHGIGDDRGPHARATARPGTARARSTLAAGDGGRVLLALRADRRRSAAARSRGPASRPARSSPRRSPPCRPANC